MIANIQGQVISQGKDHLVVLVGGIGIRVIVPRTVFDVVEGVGHSVFLFTHLAVREDALTLYGFADEQELQLFETLINVSGVGPKLALAILSALSLAQLTHAVAHAEVDLLTRVPGIGKKTAERLLLELKGKLGADLGGAATAAAGSASDVLQALIALGYSEREAAAAAKALPEGCSVDDGIRQALKSLAR